MARVQLQSVLPGSMVHIILRWMIVWMNLSWRLQRKDIHHAKKALEMSPDETWMREVLVQCEEEFHIYEEIAEFLFKRLSEIDKAFIVTEGAAYIPNVMIRHKPVEYISIIPTADFQISHYKEREWVSYVLEGCHDKAEAFNNWMQRDILFAERVKQECAAYKITCIVNDGCRNYDEIFDIVRKHFHL